MNALLGLMAVESNDKQGKGKGGKPCGSSEARQVSHERRKFDGGDILCYGKPYPLFDFPQ